GDHVRARRARDGRMARVPHASHAWQRREDHPVHRDEHRAEHWRGIRAGVGGLCHLLYWISAVHQHRGDAATDSVPEVLFNLLHAAVRSAVCDHQGGSADAAGWISSHPDGGPTAAVSVSASTVNRTITSRAHPANGNRCSEAPAILGAALVVLDTSSPG